MPQSLASLVRSDRLKQRVCDSGAASFMCIPAEKKSCGVTATGFSGTFAPVYVELETKTTCFHCGKFRLQPQREHRMVLFKRQTRTHSLCQRLILAPQVRKRHSWTSPSPRLSSYLLSVFFIIITMAREKQSRFRLDLSRN